jgi:RimJ/RimL family protein N-acetyltransferase
LPERNGTSGTCTPYPKVENTPSNAICRKLGFELLGEVDFPARRAGVVRCNDWRFDLFADGG